ncbi:MAG: 3-hydroxyacyl-CoA dehydrogenase/enoyl-CoA hydratase family protein [Bacteroidia bacterium]|nr:3-hydroxyacyl-CoA dehydrogenase/enoyl-CoA hydratase family protein [Bacteroidia bacterium]
MKPLTPVKSSDNPSAVKPRRKLLKAAVLGSGVMGSRIACHFANVGLEVLLLDIVPRGLNDKEIASGVSEASPAHRNRIVNEALQGAIKDRLNPLYNKDFATRISTGNFDDDLDKIAGCDLILEAIIEDLEIKKSLFDKVEKLRKPGSMVASNTSGIPLTWLAKGRSEDFQKNFFGMHFFNPPRYLKLLEIIPTQWTDPGLVDFIMNYGDQHLGKTMVLCKDTPAFVANRVGVFSLLKTLELVEELGLTPEETDKLTGPATGKPKTGTFRLCDLIGNDTTLKVKNGLANNLPNDEANALFNKTTVLEKAVEMGLLGDKTQKGFYKKTKGADGSSTILTLDLNTFEYRENQRPKLASLEAIKTIEDLKTRLKTLYKFEDKGGELTRRSAQAIFAYVSNRVPEIADDLYKIDDGIRAGFGWEVGAFETWDMLGVAKVADDMRAAGIKMASWVDEMLAAGHTSFYKVENGARHYYDIASKSYKVIPGSEGKIVLEYIKGTNKVWGNSGTTLIDLGDGILNLEFHTKMNSMGGEVIEGINKAIEIAEKSWDGLVIANNGENFSAGANLAMILMLAVEQEYDELDLAIRMFQNTTMRARYSSIPVVVAPHGLTLGGGCELTMHSDHAQAAAETYIGLVEVGVGLIPAGGGTKEMTLRMSDRYESGDAELNSFMNTFLTIGQAKVATSGFEAKQLGILRESDGVSVNSSRVISDAKAAALQLVAAGYQQPVQRTNIRVQGKTGLGFAYSGVYSMYAAGWITEYDLHIAKKLAYVMCGGDLDGTPLVSEQYLLDLEREVMLSLLGEERTLKRIEHMLKTGKPLRN